MTKVKGDSGRLRTRYFIFFPGQAKKNVEVSALFLCAWDVCGGEKDPAVFEVFVCRFVIDNHHLGDISKFHNFTSFQTDFNTLGGDRKEKVIPDTAGRIYDAQVKNPGGCTWIPGEWWVKFTRDFSTPGRT